MKEIVRQFLYDSWPWYIGGPLIGLFAVLVLVIERKSLGVSSSFEQFCALTIPPGEKRNTLLRDTWQVWFVLGIVLGGVILSLGNFIPLAAHISTETKVTLMSQGLSDFTGYAPVEIYRFAFPQVLILFAGGLLVGFGSRYAGGCTAGHSIMGVAQLAPSSILATVGFFAGGLVSSYLLVPYITSL